MSSTRRGFILPTTIMVMTLLTVMLTAAFILISAEFRTTDNALSMSRAHSIAQAGLQDYLTRDRGLTAASTYDSLRISYSAGYADVVARRLVPPSGAKVGTWLVRSTGTLTTNTLTGVSSAKRVVAQIAQFNPGSLPSASSLARGALIANNPIVVQTPGAVSGIDACGYSNKKGLTAWTSDITNGGNVTNGTENMSSRSVVFDSVHIDWASLKAGNFTPDVLVQGGVWPTTATGWTIYQVNGDFNIPSQFPFVRKGIIVGKGDARIQNFSAFNGIIILGGTLRGTALFWSINGVVMTGLNNAINPGTVGPDTLLGLLSFGRFQWNSCSADSAIAAMASMGPMRNGWIDTWSTY